MEIDSTGLLDYQIPAATALLRALNRNGSAVDASDCGIGKTYTTGAVLRARDVPTLVIGPKVSRPGWLRMGKHIGTSFSYAHYEEIRTGETPFGCWDNPRPKRLAEKLVCLVCQCEVRNAPCPYHALGIHCVTIKKVPHKRGKFRFYHGIKQLVFDESHRCSALTSSHADLMIAARRQGIPTIALSATVADSPMHFRALGYLLGLHNLHDFYSWAKRHGCHQMPFGGYHFACSEENQNKIMAQLHDEIFPYRGIRLRVDDIPGFPEIDVRAELYEIDSRPGQIDALYEEMADPIAAIHDSRDYDTDLPVTADMRARQEVELLKVPAFVELTHDAIGRGQHVALCVNFRATVDALCKRLKTDCRIDGSQVGERGARERMRNVGRFQDDSEPALVATYAAGSESLDMHDIRGKFSRLGLSSPTHSVRQFRQWLGRLRRAGAKSRAVYRVVLAAGTCEEKIKESLDRKGNRMDSLLDADLRP